MNSPRSVREITELIWSRRFVVAGISLSVFVLVLLASFFAPREYESSTRVRVVDNGALFAKYGRTLAAGAAAGNSGRSFVDELCSRETAGKIVDAMKLAGPGDREARIREFVDGTEVTPEESGPGYQVYRVTHRSRDAGLAPLVVARLAASFENRSSAKAATKAENAWSAAKAEAKSAKDSLVQATAALDQFEKAHADYHFEPGYDLSAHLAEAKGKLGDLTRGTEELQSRLDGVRKQLGQEKQFHTVEVKSLDQSRINALTAELATEHAALAKLRLKFTDENEAVKARLSSIGDLEKQLEAARKDVRTVEKQIPNEVWTALKGTERDILSELTVKRRIRDEFASRVEKLAAQAKQWPVVEKEWGALAAEKEKRAGALAKSEKDAAAARVVYDTRAADSTVISDVLDRPSRPTGPVSPDRALIALVGLLLGLAGGVGFVTVGSLLDRSFRQSAEVAAAFDVPVVGAISRIETLTEREAGRQKQKAALATVVVLLVMAGGLLVLQASFDGPITSFLRGVIGIR